MNKQSLTITAILFSAIIFIAGQANINITENELQTTVDTVIKVIGVLGYAFIYIKRVWRGDVTLFGKRK